MKSIYDIINEENNLNKVYSVVGPDDSIVSVWSTEEEAENDKKKMNKEAGGNSFTVKIEPIKDYIK